MSYNGKRKATKDQARPRRQSSGGTRRAPKKRKAPYWVASIAIVAVASASIGYYQYDEPEKTFAEQAPEAPVAPSAFTNASFEDTTQELCSPFEEFTCTVRWEPSSKPTGRLVKQTPEAGSRSTTVALVYSSGPRSVAMPILAGTSEQSLPLMLWEAGLTLGNVKTKPSSAPKDTVIEVSEEPAATVANGTAIDVVVSTGKIKVPDWTGKPKEFVVANAASLGIKVSFTEELSEKPAGTAIAQSSKAQIDASTSVEVTLAKGEKAEELTVPELENLTETEAISLLASAGFLKLKTVVVDANAEEAKVLRTSPPSGESIASDGTITLFVERQAS